MKHKGLLAMAITCLVITNTSCSPSTDFKVGISQLVQHPALDAATLGFKDSLTKRLLQAGKTIKFEESNAQGETTLCTISATALLSKGVDLLMANATPAFQAAVNCTETVPILGTSVTSYEEALGVKIKDNLIGTNATGTTDLASLYDQAMMIFDLVGKPERIGLIYCSSEANSLYQINEVEQHIKNIASDKGYNPTVTRYPFTDSNDIELVARNAAENSDALYVPTDNTIANCAETLKNATKPDGKPRVPVICGDEGTCKTAGIATFTISYYDLGKVTGEMAADILLGISIPQEMPIRGVEQKDFKYKYNEELCKEAGLEIDERFDGYTKI